MLAAAGIHTPEQLDELGSVEAYRHAVAAGGRPSMNFLWSIEAALLDMDWRDLPEERKLQLRDQLGSRGPVSRGPVSRGPVSEVRM
jgi:DNA transformation protein